MEIERIAACQCGAFTAVCRGEPERVSVCHCLNCKRRSGGPFFWSAVFDSGQVEPSGESRLWTRRSDEGRWCRNHFCPMCGTTVWYEIEVRPGKVSLPAGGFADPHFPAPTVSVYPERRCPWVGLPDGIEEF